MYNFRKVSKGISQGLLLSTRQVSSKKRHNITVHLRIVGSVSPSKWKVTHASRLTLLNNFRFLSEFQSHIQMDKANHTSDQGISLCDGPCTYSAVITDICKSHSHFYVKDYRYCSLEFQIPKYKYHYGNERI